MALPGNAGCSLRRAEENLRKTPFFCRASSQKSRHGGGAAFNEERSCPLSGGPLHLPLPKGDVFSLERREGKKDAWPKRKEGGTLRLNGRRGFFRCCAAARPNGLDFHRKDEGTARKRSRGRSEKGSDDPESFGRKQGISAFRFP